MSVKGPVFRTPLRNVGVKTQTAIEQAIARGWSRYRICDELGVSDRQYEDVRDAMNELAAEGAS